MAKIENKQLCFSFQLSAFDFLNDDMALALLIVCVVFVRKTRFECCTTAKLCPLFDKDKKGVKHRNNLAQRKKADLENKMFLLPWARTA